MRTLEPNACKILGFFQRSNTDRLHSEIIKYSIWFLIKNFEIVDRSGVGQKFEFFNRSEVG
jgi:hypothetical protein